MYAPEVQNLRNVGNLCRRRRQAQDHVMVLAPVVGVIVNPVPVEQGFLEDDQMRDVIHTVQILR